MKNTVKRTLTPFALGMISLTQGAASADDAQFNATSVIQSYSFQPCTSWMYSFNPNGMSGYVCSFTGMSVRVPDAASTEDTIRRLEDRIEALEKRLQALEQSR